MTRNTKVTTITIVLLCLIILASIFSIPISGHAAPKEKLIYPDEQLNGYITDISALYPKVKPELVKSIIWHESRYNAKSKTGQCVGLMQISTRWQKERAKKLGVTNFYDPYSNILVGVDCLNDLLTYNDDKLELALMLYNMNHKTAKKLYKDGKISKYAIFVIELAEVYKKGE